MQVRQGGEPGKAHPLCLTCLSLAWSEKQHIYYFRGHHSWRSCQRKGYPLIAAVLSEYNSCQRIGRYHLRRDIMPVFHGNAYRGTILTISVDSRVTKATAVYSREANPVTDGWIGVDQQDGYGAIALTNCESMDKALIGRSCDNL